MKNKENGIQENKGVIGGNFESRTKLKDKGSITYYMNRNRDLQRDQPDQPKEEHPSPSIPVVNEVRILRQEQHSFKEAAEVKDTLTDQEESEDVTSNDKKESVSRTKESVDNKVSDAKETEAKSAFKTRTKLIILHFLHK